MVTVNGTKVTPGLTVADYLRQAGFDVSRVAVEKNGEIVPRAAYGDTLIEQDDEIEVVRFVGGG